MTETLGNNSKEQLKSYVERLEAVENEISEHQADRKDIYAEAKSVGLDVKALKAIIRRRKQDAEAVEALEATVATYLAALGDYATTALGRAAMERIGG